MLAVFLVQGAGHKQLTQLAAIAVGGDIQIKPWRLEIGNAASDLADVVAFQDTGSGRAESGAVEGDIEIEVLGNWPFVIEFQTDVVQMRACIENAFVIAERPIVKITTDGDAAIEHVAAD